MRGEDGCCGRGSSEGSDDMSSRNTSARIMEMLQDMESSRPANISINELSERYNITKRRLYDLFNLFTTMGAAKHSGRKRIEWLGLKYIYLYIEERYLECEKLSITISISSIFYQKSSNTLGDIAANFMVLFPFFDVEIVSLKRAIQLLNHGGGDVKTFERRTYLVLGMLEMLGYISHIQRSGQYISKLDTSKFHFQAFLARKNRAKIINPNSIDFLLSKTAPEYNRYIFQQRKLWFQKDLYISRSSSDSN